MVDDPIAMFTARIGRTVTDEPRALANVWDALVEARSIARQPSWEWETIPDTVRILVIHAAIRLFQNPEGYTTRQAGAFSTTKAPGMVPVTMFTDAEEKQLKQYRPHGGNGLWVLETDRGYIGDADYLDPVADIQGAKSKPFPIAENDIDRSPDLQRGIPQGESPFRRGRGWF